MIYCYQGSANVLFCLTGSTEGDQSAVLGSHVNSGSRLEGKAQNNQVIVSSYTFAEINSVCLDCVSLSRYR